MSDSKPTPEPISLEQVVRLHGPWLVRWFESRLPPQIDADDLAQEAFLTLHRNWDRVRDPERLGPYLYQAARRLRRRALKNAARQTVTVAEVEHSVVDPAAGCFATQSEQLHEALRSLPDDLAQAVTAYYAEGGSYEMVAHRLGVPRATLQSRLRRALRRLRERLTPFRPGELR